MDELIDLLTSFPPEWQFSLGGKVDDAIKAFSRNNREVLSAIRAVVVDCIGGIQHLLLWIPWWLLIAAVVVLGWRATKKWYKGFLYGLMMFFIGSCGLWTYMIETLSIVIASVILSVALGFPIGVLIAVNKKVERAIRPILDLMQTMPAFVYLVPAVITIY